MEPHPYIPVVHKKNFITEKRTRASYPLNKDKDYHFGQLRTNNFRHADGEKGDRNIQIPKPKNQFRVVCLGASTTGNYIEYEGNSYSYPIELENYLKNKYPDRDIIVHNCGHGGWTTVEILINFLLNIYETDPDIVVIYHAYNDLIPSLTPGFTTDYSHAKRNLGETYHLYRLASYFPNIPLAIFNAFLRRVFPYINPRNDVIRATSCGKASLHGSFWGLNIYRRNIEHIVKICLSSNINVVLSTFTHYLYNDIKNSPSHLKFREGVILENSEILKIAEKYDLPLVDNFNDIPQREENYVDSIHFSHIGMKKLAENFGEEISKMMVSVQNKFKNSGIN
jgi:lysophospholipase L1-like esterase